MRYIRTNEELNFIDNKRRKKFSEVLQKIKDFIISKGYSITDNTDENVPYTSGYSRNEVLESHRYKIKKDNSEYGILITLIKSDMSGIFIKDTYVQLKIYGNIYEQIGAKIDEFMKKMDSDFGIIMDRMHTADIRKLKEKDFFDEYPIDTISDHLIDLMDVLGKYTVSKSYNLTYTIKFDEHIFKKNKMDNSFDVIEDNIEYLICLSNLKKSLSSIGLDVSYKIDKDRKLTLLINQK